jgi:predicted Zn-dependent protease
LLLVPVLLVQAACVGTATTMQRYPAAIARPAPQPETQPEFKAPPPAETQPVAPEPPPEAKPASGGAPSSDPPAVLALMSEAQASAQSGDLENAAATLERAIRIQPRNPRLWHELAQVRLKQQQPVLAEDLAKKSNLHAQGDPGLVRANWTLVAEARRLKGDAEGEAEARRKAGE